MRIQGRSSRRRGYTLLEVVLAVSISVVLIGALYTAISVQFQYAKGAREIVDESSIVRALLAKITSDVAPIQGPVSPFLNVSGAYVNSSTTASPSNSSASSSSSGSSSSSSGSSSSGSSSSGSSGSSSGSSSTTNSNLINVALTNIGVQGDGESVVFTVSRAPRELLTNMAKGEQDESTPVCDLRRISYRCVEGKGLVRTEDTNITDPANIVTTPGSGPTGSTGASAAESVLAAEVESMTIQYFGNGQWLGTWDGTTFAQIGTNSTTQTSTQQGPPALIKFTFKLKLPSASKGGAAREVTVSHTVAIAAANRFVTSATAPQASGSAP